MGQGIDYQKQMTETVYVNLPGPREPTAGMMGGELLHGFLAELYNAPNQATRDWVIQLCNRWNIVYRQKTD
jgi:hypothetical protein